MGRAGMRRFAVDHYRCTREAPAADDDPIVARIGNVNTVRPRQLGTWIEIATYARESTGMLIEVEQEHEHTDDRNGPARKVSSQVAKDCRAALAVGSSATIQASVANLTRRGRVSPRRFVTEACRVERSIQHVDRTWGHASDDGIQSHGLVLRIQQVTGDV